MQKCELDSRPAALEEFGLATLSNACFAAKLAAQRGQQIDRLSAPPKLRGKLLFLFPQHSSWRGYCFPQHRQRRSQGRKEGKLQQTWPGTNNSAAYSGADKVDETIVVQCYGVGRKEEVSSSRHFNRILRLATTRGHSLRVTRARKEMHSSLPLPKTRFGANVASQVR